MLHEIPQMIYCGHFRTEEGTFNFDQKQNCPVTNARWGGVQSLCPNVGSYKLNGGSLNSLYTIGAKNSVVLESHSLFHSSCIQLSNLVHSVVLFSPNMPRTWGPRSTNRNPCGHSASAECCSKFV